MNIAAQPELGATVDHGDRVTRYGMVGDTYLTPSQVGDRADALWAAYSVSLFSDPPFVGIAYRMGLSDTNSQVKALTILAKASVTWADICRMKS